MRQFCTTARASRTLQNDISGRETPPTVTILTALFSFLPRQSGHGSSVIYDVSRDLVRFELVSV